MAASLLTWGQLKRQSRSQLAGQHFSLSSAFAFFYCLRFASQLLLSSPTPILGQDALPVPKSSDFPANYPPEQRIRQSTLSGCLGPGTTLPSCTPWNATVGGTAANGEAATLLKT